MIPVGLLDGNTWFVPKVDWIDHHGGTGSPGAQSTRIQSALFCSTEEYKSLGEIQLHIWPW